MQEEIVRLHMNEVPCLPPQQVIEAARQGLSNLNRYTGPEGLDRLKGLLAGYSGVPKEQIVLSPGSDLLLREMVLIFSRGRKVVVASPSFFPTFQVVEQFATKLVSVELRPPAFDLDLDTLMDELREPCLVVIDNPNNPTGRLLLDRQAVEAIVEREETLLVVDEAYYEFGGLTCADMVQNCPNLAVTRTMDKAFGLAGARVGYALAGQAFVEAFSAFYAFLPQSSLCAAIAALNHPDYMRRSVQEIIAERERVRRALEERGEQVYASAANFLLLKTAVPDMARELGAVGVLVSDLSHQLPAGFLRVSIGTRKENDAFIAGYMKIRRAFGACD